MTDNLRRILKDTYSKDTAAGDKLQYYIMRALASEIYAKQIGFAKFAYNLCDMFIWNETREGYAYWHKISKLHHQT